MDEQFDFRALLIKLQDCLSDNDRRRLHFIVGDTIPRHLRDDPTLGGTLSLLESLLDQAKISEQDFNYLIHAFNEIHCYAAVKRLEEHQFAQNQRNRSGTNTTTTSDVLDDNEEDKINVNKHNNFGFWNSSEARDSTSSQSTTVSLDPKNTNKDILPLTKVSIQSEKRRFKIDKTALKSRLTICQLILFILNIIGIIIFVLLIIFLTKPKNSISDVLVVKVGTLYGNPLGGEDFNDAQDTSLTFNDRIVNINAGWTSDILDYVTFVYSNGGSMQHGRQTYRYSPYMSEFKLDSDDDVNGVTVYTGTRLINNPYAPNGSFLIVGLRFYSNKGQISKLFGSSNGTQTNENFSNFTIGYVRGRALGYVDALQFIWYSRTSPSTIATLSMY